MGGDVPWIATVLGLCGAGMNLVWPRFRGRTGMLLGQTGVCVFFALHYWMVGAITGAVMNIIAIVQALLAIPLGERPGFRIAYLLTLPVIGTGLWMTWEGVPSVCAAVGFALLSIGRYQLSPIRFRVFLIAAIPAWIVHNIIKCSIPGLIADACALSGIVMLRIALREQRDASRATPHAVEA